MKRHVSASELLDRVDEILGSTPRLADRRRRLLPYESVVRREPGILDLIAMVVQSGRGYLHVSIYLDGGTLLLRRGMAGAPTDCTTMNFGEGVVGTAAQDGRTRVVPDVSADRAYRKVLDATRSEIAVPIKLAGRVFGVLNAESERGNDFAYDDRVFLSEVAHRIAHYLTTRGRFLLLEVRESVAAGLV